jgi:hypothetical protein
MGFLISSEFVIFAILSTKRRSAGVVELARLESVYIRKGIKGSNPFSSANKSPGLGLFYFHKSMTIK